MIHFNELKTLSKMKKYFLLYSLILLAMISCQKDPDTSKLDNDFPVSTNYDKSAVFPVTVLSTFRIVS